MTVNIVTGSVLKGLREAGCKITTICKCKGYTRKMVPITGRASSFLEFLFIWMYVNRKEEELGETEQLQSYQFPKVI